MHFPALWIRGLGGAKLLYKSTNFSAGGFLPGFDVTPNTLALGSAIAIVLMVASGLVPADCPSLHKFARVHSAAN